MQNELIMFMLPVNTQQYFSVEEHFYVVTIRAKFRQMLPIACDAYLWFQRNFRFILLPLLSVLFLKVLLQFLLFGSWHSDCLLLLNIFRKSGEVIWRWKRWFWSMWHHPDAWVFFSNTCILFFMFCRNHWSIPQIYHGPSSLCLWAYVAITSFILWLVADPVSIILLVAQILKIAYLFLKSSIMWVLVR